MARNHEIRVKVSLEEFNSIKNKARTMGLSPSSFLRMAGLIAEPEAFIRKR